MEILKTCHDEAGHPGRENTYNSIYRKYIGIRKIDVTRFISSCDKCPRKDIRADFETESVNESDDT
jgi:hypothetical protein